MKQITDYISNKMVFLVYSESSKFDGIYEDGQEASIICSSRNIDAEDVWKVADLVYFMKKSSKFKYSEEDLYYDESYYIQEIDKLKYSINNGKKKLKILEEFTDYFTVLLLLSILYSILLIIIFTQYLG